MLPQTSSTVIRPRIHRNRSSSSSSSSDPRHHHGDDTTILHVEEFLDDHLPPEFFRQDIVRLTHELRIPGWSAVEQDMAEDLELIRISGALTNSVYCVRPPGYIKERIKREYAGRPYHHRLPPTLLLRVYGPQVGFLIDRDQELATVAHLTKHNIGPRLMGTFTNGRFEQYLNATPLTRHDLRHPETSVLIAKRMRDLHDNVPLAPKQRKEGPLVWQNLQKWRPVAMEQIERFEARTPGISAEILGTPDPAQFWAALEAYERWLAEKYPEMSEMLVFSHNDTQYGNILRLEPPKGSPLLQPQNEHRQLVVIDFEYSGPNTRAYDIANHFCEWMSDYHHPTMSYHIWLDRFPTREEQLTFINSYVEHGSSDFDEAKMDAEAAQLMQQTAEWVPAVSAHWAIWGIVQTPADQDLEIREEFLLKNKSYELLPSQEVPGESSSRAGSEPLEGDAEGDVFDYVSYSREKIQLFWHDIRALGVPVPAVGSVATDSILTT